MTAGSRRDDDLEPGDRLDRAIDETLGVAMHAHAVDLRERVLARLDEPDAVPPARWRFVLRPALLPAAGAALLIIGVALTWQHVDNTLARIGAPRPVPTVARTRPPAPPASKTTAGAAGAPVTPAGSGARAALPDSTLAAVALSRERRLPVADHRIAAASVLEMDAMSAPAKVGADIVIPGDDAELASTLPGAMGGDLGDPIKPLPPLRLLVIPPIVVAPILDAPPVSTLAPTVSTIPTVGEIPRDPSDPGKPGGVRQ